MASMAFMIKNCFAAILALAWITLPAGAASFSVKRGINLDIWTTWPGESRWGESDVLLPFPEWRRTVGDPELKALRKAGFDFVRMPVDPAPFLSGTTGRLRDRLFEEVVTAARLVQKAGLKVIVDLHLIPAGDDRSVGMKQVMDDPDLFARYVELVRQMARALAREDPSRLALELMNEPVIDCEGPAAGLWPDRLKKLFAAARASATRLTLILEGGCWGSAEGLAALDPSDFPDDNIIWSFHSYAPFLLTHQGATWAGDFIRYVTGIPYPPHELKEDERDRILENIRRRIRTDAPLTRRGGMLAYLDEEFAKLDTAARLDAALSQPFETVAAWAGEHGVEPQDIILGEFGMIRQEYGSDAVMPAASRAAYVGDMVERAEARGYGWSVWSYGGAFGIVDEFGGRKAEPDVMQVVRDLK
ncbi:glycoside hydrolase family 5 protein [Mesorhizobium sp. L-8-10]|uniref:glycoside hydrolase family 5 protein n=1 Tax=Mesorhizobium sp. L-8-10 TaxID=2744523 RepID=UPI001928F362|nr:cellulase family glycosylhydrolase [Mesorhizobium sp. L-8-10]